MLRLLTDLLELLNYGEQQVHSPQLWSLFKSVFMPLVALLLHRTDERNEKSAARNQNVDGAGHVEEDDDDEHDDHHGTHKVNNMADQMVMRDVVDVVDIVLCTCQNLSILDQLLADQFQSGSEVVRELSTGLAAYDRNQKYYFGYYHGAWQVVGHKVLALQDKRNRDFLGSLTTHHRIEKQVSRKFREDAARRPMKQNAKLDKNYSPVTREATHRILMLLGSGGGGGSSGGSGRSGGSGGGGGGGAGRNQGKFTRKDHTLFGHRMGDHDAATKKSEAEAGMESGTTNPYAHHSMQSSMFANAVGAGMTRVSLATLGSTDDSDDESFSPFAFEKVKAHESFDVKVAAFRLGLAKNPNMKMIFMRKPFALVDLLENGSTSAMSAKKDVVSVTWNMIVSRFVAYCSEQYLVEDLDLNDDFGMETCVLCFNIFRDHLMKCRSHLLDKDGNKLKVNGLPDHGNPKGVSIVMSTLSASMDLDERREMMQRQDNLSELGVVKLMARVVASMVSAEEGDLPDVALAVLNELLFGGNRTVQNTLHEFLETEDTDGQFLKHMQQRLEQSLEMIDEGKKYGMLGTPGKDVSITDEVREGVLNASQTVIFCRQLCVNHCAMFQELLREQPGQ